VDCPHTPWLETDAFLERFNRRAIAERIPLSGSIALTNRCNLRCAHCYVGDCRWSAGGSPELSTAEFRRVLDEITGAGCLYLILTGGEPLVRPDFAEIYTHARGLGLIVTVFTNATLVDARVVSLFQEYPPQSVEITLYGGTAATYERITGVAGAYDKCLAGIERLVAGHVRLALKTVLLSLNQAELPAMEDLARRFGAKFRLDPAVFPRFDGDRAPLELRLPADQAVRLEFANPETVRAWTRYVETRVPEPASEHLYTCGAGRTTFHVDADGGLYPCLMTRRPRYDLRTGPFMVGWNEVIPQVRTRGRPPEACRACEHRLLCGYCPPFAELETGSEETPPPYLCALGKARAKALAELSGGGREA